MSDTSGILFLHERTKYMMMQFISLCHTRPTIEIMVIFRALNFQENTMHIRGLYATLPFIEGFVKTLKEI